MGAEGVEKMGEQFADQHHQPLQIHLVPIGPLAQLASFWQRCLAEIGVVKVHFPTDRTAMNIEIIPGAFETGADILGAGIDRRGAQGVKIVVIDIARLGGRGRRQQDQCCNQCACSLFYFRRNG